MHRKNFYAKYGKRVLDIICGVSAIIIFWWIYVLIAILVRIKLGGPVIYVAERAGKIDIKIGRAHV